MRAALLAVSLLLLPTEAQAPGWEMVAPAFARRTGTLSGEMTEASGAAVSRLNRGIIWTINDSGNPPELIATDTLGRFRGSISLTGATNVDWEEVALGPCGTARCVYIADVGDNTERRREVVLYRLPEPQLDLTVSTPAKGSSRNVETLHFRYPDGPHDVEAMSVLASGDVVLVTKGRSGGVLLFRVGSAAWQEQSATVATRIDSLPIAASSGTGELITGMALSPDGKRAVVRSYRTLYPFDVRVDGTMRPAGKPTACDILGLEPQGEGIAFLDDRRLVLTSERGLFKAGTVMIVECTVAPAG